MPREFKITQGPPDEAFWAGYRELWQNSVERSPFKAPRILQYFAQRTLDRIVVFQALRNGRLRGAVILKERKGNLTFLSDLKTDVNSFVLHAEDDAKDWAAFFRYLLSEVKSARWSLTLNNQPAWASYRPAFEDSEKTSGLYWRNIPYSVCPYLEAATPQALFERVNGMRELRYRVNRLKNQEHAEFEVFTQDDDLDTWVEQFCDVHVQRWADTPTPSHLGPREERQFLKDCFHAWHADAVLVRFSIRLSNERIGFVVGLRHKQSLIHHSTTYSPQYAKFSPGKALIHHMAHWMSLNGYNKLDFGDGNEPYKYTVADQEHKLERIFISGRADLKFVGRSQLIKFVREHPYLYTLYQRRLKPLFGAP